MFNPDCVPPVEDDELLARYATQRGHFRASDQFVKQSLFAPHPHQELSVTRHREATEDEVWAAGNHIATEQARTLYGRSDIRASDCKINGLNVVANKVDGNPNHADIIGWPAAKEEQMIIAKRLAAAASKLIPPPKAFACLESGSQ